MTTSIYTELKSDSNPKRRKLSNQLIDQLLVGRNIRRIGDYTVAKHKIQWKCTTCGYEWEATPNNVINNNTGCRSCSQTMITHKVLCTKLQGRYINLVGELKSTRTRTTWECAVCSHTWVTTPTSILDNKSGCPKCSKSISPINQETEYELYQRSIKQIGQYVNSSTNIEWQCTKCQYVWQATPNNVINCGTGCPRCIKRVSNPETLWLKFLNVPNTPECRQVTGIIPSNKHLQVDGYDSSTNTVYEFWGDYWHGNPKIYDPTDVNVLTKKTFGELYQKTLTKRQAILDAGFNLVEIWECDWNNISS